MKTWILISHHFVNVKNYLILYRYEMGLMKLEQSADDVNAMSLELEALQPMLQKSSNEVMDLLKVNILFIFF